MTKLFILLAAVVAQGSSAPVKSVPLKIDGAALAASDYVATGTVTPRPTAIALDGGRIELSTARQKALDTQMGKSLSIVATLVDHSSANTTAMTLGQLKLMRTDNIWFLVNQSEGKWRQVEIGQAPEGAPLKLALVFDGKEAALYRDGKSVGVTPYEPVGAQKLTLGSAADEKTPWKGEIREFEILTKGLKAEEVAKRANPTPANTNTTTQPTSTQAATKSTTVEAELVALTEVPDPQSILPYREALITHEYKILSVKSGSIPGAGAGATIRVARWGIVSSKKTDVANLKKGAKLTLILERVSDHPALERQYTVDDLPENFAAPYLLDVSTKGGGN
jgi:hypothetical protein